MDNKNVFAKNLKYQMDLKNKSRKEVCEALGFSYYTFSDWVSGKKYPRMDKVEMLANYFGILKSDLIEEKQTEHKDMHKKNDVKTDIVLRMNSDSDFFELLKTLYDLDANKIAGVRQMLNAFLK